MYANRNHLASWLCFVGVLGINSAAAQTLDEITQLQRAKVAAELSKKQQEAMPIASVTLAPMTLAQGGALASAGRTAQEPAPIVVAIYGLASNLSAAIMQSSGERPLHMREGEQTPSGWVVQRITPSGVHFVRASNDQTTSANKTATKQGRKASPRVMFVPWMPTSLVSPSGAQAMPALASPVGGLSTLLPVPMPFRASFVPAPAAVQASPESRP